MPWWDNGTTATEMTEDDINEWLDQYTQRIVVTAEDEPTLGRVEEIVNEVAARYGVPIEEAKRYIRSRTRVIGPAHLMHFI